MKSTPLVHLVRLARRLNDKASAEERSSFIAMLEAFNTLTNSGYKCLLGAGVMSVLGYLLVSIRFYPSGLTLGDGFFFLMVAFAFGFAYLLFILAGFLLAQLLLYLYTSIKKNGIKAWRQLLATTGLVCALVLGLVMMVETCNQDKIPLLLGALVGFSASGLCLTLLIESLDDPAAKKSQKWFHIAMWTGLLFMPLLLSSSFVQRMNENVVMSAVGLRITDVTLKLSEENYDILSSVASGQNIAVLGCRESASGQPERLIHGVNLLWHGVGERSLVELPTASKPNLIVELKRDGVYALRNYAGAVERCLELSGDVLFEPGSSNLLAKQAELKEIIDVISSSKNTIRRIQVIGHADALGYTGNFSQNNKLAVDRAEAVKDSIVSGADIEKERVTAEGRGAREPKTLCKDWPIKATLAECLAVNRRVEVRIEFNPVQPEPPCKNEDRDPKSGN